MRKEKKRERKRGSQENNQGQPEIEKTTPQAGRDKSKELHKKTCRSKFRRLTTI